MTRKLESLITNTLCTHIYIKTLQNIKYNVTMILLYGTMHCRVV
jgi:hypothetical protein